MQQVQELKTNRPELYEENGLLVHEATLNAETAQSIRVPAFYLPQRFIHCWEELIGLDSTTEQRVKTNSFREITHSRYREVICTNFTSRALLGQEPFLLLRPSVSDHKVFLIYHQFIRFFEQKVKYFLQNLNNNGNKPSKDFVLPELEIENDSEIHRTEETLYDLSQMKGYKIYLSAWFADQYQHRIHDVIQMDHFQMRKFYGTKKDKKTSLVPSSMYYFPNEWYTTTYDVHSQIASGLQLTKSEPNKQGDGEYTSKLLFSYFINLDFDKEVDESISIRFFVSIKRWLMHMEKNGELYMPRKNSRSLYIMNHQLNKMVRLRFHEYNNQLQIINRFDIADYLKSIEMPSLESIVTNLYEYRNQYLIPYQVYDKGLEDHNNVEVGAHPNEQLIMFQAFMEAFPFLELRHTDFEKVENDNLVEDLEYQRILLSDVLERKEENIDIEVFAESKHYVEQAKLALRRLVEGTTDEGEQMDEQFKENNVTRYQLQESNDPNECTDDDHLQYSYRLLDKQTGWIAAQLSIRHYPQYENLARPLEMVLDRDSEQQKRIQEIRNVLAAVPREGPTLTLVHIGKEPKKGGIKYGSKMDPKKSVKKGLLETKRISQMFHTFPDKDKLQHIMLSSVSDLLVRKGFHNQRAKYLAAATQRFTYYFPMKVKVDLYNGNSGFMLVLFRMHQGILNVKFKETDWLELDQAIVHLSASNKPHLIEQEEEMFLPFFMPYCKDEKAVLVFRNWELPEVIRMQVEKGKFPYKLALFYHGKDIPYISNMSKGKVSTGKFMVKTKEEFLCVPPKAAQMKFNQSQTKQTHNRKMQRVVPMKIKVINAKEDNEIAVALHMMRSSALTWQTFLRNPLPYHLFDKHMKEFCTDRWENEESYHDSEDDTTEKFLGDTEDDYNNDVEDEGAEMDEQLSFF